MEQKYKIQLGYTDPKNVNEVQKKLLERVKKKFGYVPNLQKNMVNYPPLTKTYLDAVAAFRKDSGFTDKEVDTIFLALSFENNCDYCVAAHSLIGQIKSKIPTSIIEELREGKELSDTKLNVLRNFAVHMLLSRGWPEEIEAKKFLDIGYTETHILAIIHAISIKTISNYVNHVFHTDLDKPLKAFEWKPLRKIVSFLKR